MSPSGSWDAFSTSTTTSPASSTTLCSQVSTFSDLFHNSEVCNELTATIEDLKVSY